MYQSHRLRILQELALRGTLAAVAEALSYSPSTISHQLAQLEKEAGVRLLEPDGRRVRLTPQGEALAAHARRMLDLEEEIEQELKTRPGRTTGSAPSAYGRKDGRPAAAAMSEATVTT